VENQNHLGNRLYTELIIIAGESTLQSVENQNHPKNRLDNELIIIADESTRQAVCTQTQLMYQLERQLKLLADNSTRQSDISGASRLMQIINCFSKRQEVLQRVNMESDLQGLFVHSCTHWLRPRTSPPFPRIWAHIRGRSWSTKIDDISL